MIVGYTYEKVKSIRFRLTDRDVKQAIIDYVRSQYKLNLADDGSLTVDLDPGEAYELGEKIIIEVLWESRVVDENSKELL